MNFAEAKGCQDFTLLGKQRVVNFLKAAYTSFDVMMLEYGVSQLNDRAREVLELWPFSLLQIQAAIALVKEIHLG